LIFDTGTNTTVLAPTVAARAGLSVGQATRVESLNQAAAAIQGEVSGIGFDGAPAVGPKIAVAANVGGLRGFGRSVSGLYGHNWLAGMDYLIDYRAKQIMMGAAGSVPAQTGGSRAALSWAAGRPAVTAMVRAHSVEPFPARLVLDSGADHVTLFGRAAARIAPVGDWTRTMVIDSGFGTREVPTALALLNVDGRERSVPVELRSDVTDRQEDGLVPTSLFRSVFVSSAEAAVIFDGSLPASPRLQRTSACPAGDRERR